MSVLAYDLGAGSGRALLGHLNDRGIETSEIHRFKNEPVKVGERMHWDILRLHHELLQGLTLVKQQGEKPESLGIDSWGVDFGLLGSNGELLGNPYHYRDTQFNGMMDQVRQELSSQRIFERTGIQFLSFNTLYQLATLQRSGSPLLHEAERFLMIPDLLRYFLTGEAVNEFTNATTTQLYNPSAGQWDSELLAHIRISEKLFGEAVLPGTRVGQLRSSICNDLGLSPIPVIAVAEHDTGSAVVAVPATERSFAYLSCGTWSLMGTEIDHPAISSQSLALNFTNEGGAGGTFRLLKNIMGLWILQESMREWDRQGQGISYDVLLAKAEQAPPFASLFDPDDELFMPAGDMTKRIRQYCRDTGQVVPEDQGAIARAILESLALKYRRVLEWTEQLSGQMFNGLHMVGGGIQNRLLCQWTANSIGKPVWAGPAEGSAIGNMAVQWMASGAFKDIWEARKAIRDSFPVTTYEPQDKSIWEDAYGRFLRVTASSNSQAGSEV
ncbi:rhamnulokinase family protein [Paenibacillus sp. FSL L8-0435]|uniref:rhamnulokinase n=1 Tax=unclassified Paenibacillus TaxID=185978 RepID=UPI00096D613E|nr:rhamnulokinase family protein [Paenibacillus sp. FSL R5-0765]OMF60144.1 rhamnulokinase [Paenibacillus sp. FSL R5-0765]